MAGSPYSYESKRGTVFRVFEINSRAEYNESNEKVIVIPKEDAANMTKKSLIRSR